MKLNKAVSRQAFTHEGAPAFPHLTPIQSLRRSVLSCLLWEDSFYESGQSIAERITECAALVSTEDLAALAVEARSVFNLRHVPLLLLAELSKRGGSLVSQTIENTIQRPDEMAEFLAVYWREGKHPLAKQVKKGLAAAFRKFNAYSLAKYNRDGAIKLRDVLFLTHAKPQDDEQAETWKALAAGTLTPPDTWEVALSSGADKRETFERLIREGRLGYLALLRNLRNMAQAGCDMELVAQAIEARKGAERVFPFRYVAAARACPQLEPSLDRALLAAIDELPALPGMTAVLVDVSGSMVSRLSAKSDMQRIDAACALAAIMPGQVRMFSFSEHLVEVPPRRGMAGVDAITRSHGHGVTNLAGAVRYLNEKIPHDRLIVITDEQAGDGRVPSPVGRGYMINVGTYRNGVGYGAWTHIDGFSESVLRFIAEIERDG